ncbi:MAG: PASTA domain-containing protein [Thermodesulfobacteriota bacterium]
MPEDFEEIKRKLDEARKEIRQKDQRINDLAAEKQQLEDRIAGLQRQRPRLRPNQLSAAFRTALDEMQQGLATGEGRAEYIVSRFETDLKINLTLDESENINFQLPGLDDIIPAENLSTLRLSFRPVPRASAPPADTIEVPNLIGMPKASALEAARAGQFTVGSTKELTSRAPEGTVIDQEPPPYSHTTAGTEVNLVISKRKQVEVPNVIGMEPETAAEAINSAGLSVGAVTEQASESPPGTIISQNPAPGTLAPVDSQMAIVIARSETIEVPAIVGLYRDKALAVLEEAKLKPGKISHKQSQERPYTVIAQNPGAGREVSPASAVDLILSMPKTVKVPDFRSVKQAEAEKMAKEFFLVIERTVTRRSRQPRGTVIDQKPEAGAEVAAGSAVTLTLSQGMQPG